jgi:hypothetical protein
LDLIGYASSISEAAAFIDAGRKGFAIKGKAEEGRISFEKGIAQAMASFREASNQKLMISLDPYIMILAEYTFLSQELEFCDETDKDSISSATLTTKWYTLTCYLQIRCQSQIAFSLIIISADTEYL